MNRLLGRTTFFLSILVFSLDLSARAGGAGGGSDEFGYGSGPEIDAALVRIVLEFVFKLVRMGPFGWLILAAVGFIVYKIFTSYRIQYAEKRVRPDRIRVNKGFPVDPMLRAKVETAFRTVQQAWSEQRPELMRRFITDGVYQRFCAQWSHGRVVYDRLYLNSVMARSIEWRDGFLHANVHVRFTYRQPPSSQLITQGRTLVLVHKPANVLAKGTIYANACPTCGAPQKDSLSHRCIYCGSNLNDITRDWIVGGIF